MEGQLTKCKLGETLLCSEVKMRDLGRTEREPSHLTETRHLQLSTNQSVNSILHQLLDAHSLAILRTININCQTLTQISEFESQSQGLNPADPGKEGCGGCGSFLVVPGSCRQGPISEPHTSGAKLHVGTPISAAWIISRGRPVANVLGIFPHQPNVCRATALKLCSGYLRP